MTHETILSELDSFQGREENLRRVTRYSLYQIMFYRTNLWTHSKRVAWIVKKLVPIAEKVFGSDFDDNKAIALALVHDDPEIIFGDVQAGNKAKMSPEELAKVDELERNAIVELTKRFPKKIAGYEYKDLLLTAVDKSCLESILVDWADKFDAFGEALHEIFAGNAVWTINVVNEYGTILLPTEYYLNYFNNFQKKFPKSIELFEQENSLFKIPESLDIKKIVQEGLLHTAESIHQKTGYEPYDVWIEFTLQNGTQEDIADLYTKKE